MYSEISSLLLITEILSLTARVPEARPRNSVIEGGFPHSEIRGPKLVRSSPRLIAAYHVLHRLSAPRHPPNTLKALDRSHYRCPPLGSGRAHSRKNANDTSIERPFASNASENVAVKQTSTAGMLGDSRRFTCDRHTIGCTSSSRCRKSWQ